MQACLLFKQLSLCINNEEGLNLLQVVSRGDGKLYEMSELVQIQNSMGLPGSHTEIGTDSLLKFRCNTPVAILSQCGQLHIKDIHRNDR